LDGFCFKIDALRRGAVAEVMGQGNLNDVRSYNRLPAGELKDIEVGGRLRTTLTNECPDQKDGSQAQQKCSSEAAVTQAGRK